MPADLKVCLGNQLYRVDRPWPAGYSDFRAMCDVAVLKDGRVVAVFRREPQLVVFSPDGSLLESWVVPQLVNAHYARARPGGGLLVADLSVHAIVKLDSRGRFEGYLGQPGQPAWAAPFNSPTCAVETPDGTVYASDGYGNSCLHAFRPDGSHWFTKGQPGTGPGQFSTPHAVVVTPDRQVLVSDRENNRVQVFDAEGNWLRDIGLVYKPMALALTPDGHLLVTDQTPRLSLFSLDGTLLGRCRTDGVSGHGVSVGPDGSIYLAEMVPDTLTRLTPVAS